MALWDKFLRLLVLVLNSLPMEIAKKAADAALDVVEEEVKKTPNKIDDIIVLPLIQILRKFAKIPDFEPHGLSISSKPKQKSVTNTDNRDKGGLSF